MRDLHCCRLARLYFVFALSMVMCDHTTFAAMVEPPAAAPQNAAPVVATAAPTPSEPASALTPEIEGDLLMVHRSYAAAIAAYSRETDRSAVLLNKIGVAYHHLFALEQARKYYQQALAMNPSYPDALNNLAAVYHGEKDYRQAERTYKQALKFAPNAAITYCNLGTSYFAEEKYKAGTEAYSKALALNPHIFEPGQIQIVDETSSRRQIVAVNYYLAKTYATAGKMQESLSYLRKALQAGFRDRKQLMRAKEFAALRTTPEFHQLMLEQTGGE